LTWGADPFLNSGKSSLETFRLGLWARPAAMQELRRW
jgi:hypothetical protein